MGLFGESLILTEFPKDKKISGIGMSEWGRISDILADKFNFVNTFYHTEPKLDILNIDTSIRGSFDFVICSEVFEHIPPPIQPAFNNLAEILKPTGFVVFSVPWAPTGYTREHFPDLFDWAIRESDKGHVLVNRTAQGIDQEFEGLVFHGGPGQTLEMRLFSIGSLRKNFANAGLDTINVADEQENPRFGIVFEPWSRGLVARRSVSAVM
jgi:SAM-dependent methyltransferase